MPGRSSKLELELSGLQLLLRVWSEEFNLEIDGVFELPVLDSC
jgi:hypothetical protein